MIGMEQADIILCCLIVEIPFPTWNFLEVMLVKIRWRFLHYVYDEWYPGWLDISSQVFRAAVFLIIDA